MSDHSDGDSAIRLGNPAVDDAEIGAVSEVLNSGTLSTGEIVADFESRCTELVGCDHAAAVASGSVALELAIHVSDISKGSGVVVSPYNCGAVLYSLLREGVVPIFADIDPETYNLDPDAASAAIEDADVSIEGLLAVHLYGQPCEMDALRRLTNEHDLTLIDDFAQSIGATFRGQPVGSFGDLGVGSFGATKNLTTAEGGVVVGDEAELIERVRHLRSNTNDPLEGEHLRSVRMNDIEAAIGREQLAKYADILERKRTAADVYDQNLSDVVETSASKRHVDHVYHGYPIRSSERDELSAFLAKHDIETAAVYDTPLYSYPGAETRVDDPESAFPNTARAAKEVLLLPIHGSITPGDARTVATAVEAFFDG